MRSALYICCAALLAACSQKAVFKPQSGYPPDPWVKGYSQSDDCLGGENLATRRFYLPEYPRRAFNSGRQGWVIMRLDVNATGELENVSIERSVPEGMFDSISLKTVEGWLFEPPVTGRLENCRVLFRFRAGEVTLGS